MPLIKIQPSSLNISATYTVAGVVANGVNIGPTLVSAFNTANAAFNKANQVGGAVDTANTNITNLSGAVNTANVNITAAFLKANQVGGAVDTANSNITAAFFKANQVGEAVTTANNNIANLSGALTTANSNITSAFNKANNALPLTGGTITGDISIVGNISVTGNTSYIAVQNYQVDDPLIYLAGNNYVSDIVDIGFIANYNNATGSNVHTGLFRDHTTKEYYLFQGYDKEPVNNHIDPNGNNFTISILNAAIRTSNLILGGINALPWIVSIYDTANLSLNQANAVAGAVNTANVNITAAFLKANQVGGAVDTANNNIANLSGALVTANSNITSAFLKANQVGSAVDTANGNITAAFLKANSVAGAVDTANGNIVAAFNQANTALYIANLAFDKANTGGGGGGSANIAILDEGTYLTNTVSSINFVGSAVTASNVGNDITVTITGGGGGGTSITTSIVTGTTQTAVKDYRYVLTNTSVTTVTLPATPTLGDSLYILVANALSNNVVDRNGTKLMGLDENMIIDIANSSIGLVYVNTTLGWRLI